MASLAYSYSGVQEAYARLVMGFWLWTLPKKKNHKQINSTIVLLKIYCNQGSFLLKKCIKLKRKINTKSSQFSQRFTSKVNLIKYKVYNLLNNIYTVPVVTVAHYLCSRFTYWSFLARLNILAAIIGFRLFMIKSV